MPVTMRGNTYYRTSEVCEIVGIGRSTLLRWLRRNILKGASHRDRRGWRLFTQADIERIENEANHVR